MRGRAATVRAIAALRLLALVGAVVVAACHPSGGGGESLPNPVRGRGPTVRVLLGDAPAGARQGAYSKSFPGERVSYNGTSYRGALMVDEIDGRMQVVNFVALEDYLRGVVPIEIGPRARNERAAVQAQAVAARTFTVARLRAGRGRPYDVVAGTADQAYGGMAVEREESDEAILGTAGLVLRIGERVVDAPFHSSCGGETAAAEEVWQTSGSSHLQRVSDKIPGSDRYYCDIAPRFYWERSFAASELDLVVGRYLRNYASVAANGVGSVRAMRINGRTPSGRVRELEIQTTTGRYAVRGNDARSVLRGPTGDGLPSAYFTIDTESVNGGIVRAVVRGNGYGHGVGMCQWGAIGRARVGQSARAILRTYYPGTSLGPIPARYLD